MHMTLTMLRTFMRILSRDRQALFFSLFFPMIFMTVFGLVGSAENDPIDIGIADLAGNALSASFIDSLESSAQFIVHSGSESELREQVINGDLQLLLVVPSGFSDNGTPAQLNVIVDAAQVRELGLIMPVLQQALVEVERSLRNEDPLFSLQVEDVKARAQNYLSFLVPGLLAFTIMQIAVAGSGYNIVEYRRKGILKRLFVTPLQPQNFIGGLVLARMLFCLVQLTLLLLIAMFMLKVQIAGNFLSLYVVIILATVVFLSVGFCMGSLAKTQQSIMALGNIVTFPQMFLSGIFYPISILPVFIQPLAKILPLSFVATGLRDIIVNGESLLGILPSLAGLAVWSVIALGLAIRLFRWKEVAA